MPRLRLTRAFQEQVLTTLLPAAHHAFPLQKFQPKYPEPSCRASCDSPQSKSSPTTCGTTTSKVLTAQEWVTLRVAESEELLWRKTCSQCHALTFTANASLPSISKSNIPSRWFAHAVFDHDATFLKCIECHAAWGNYQPIHCGRVLLPESGPARNVIIWRRVGGIPLFRMPHLSRLDQGKVSQGKFGCSGAGRQLATPPRSRPAGKKSKRGCGRANGLIISYTPSHSPARPGAFPPKNSISSFQEYFWNGHLPGNRRECRQTRRGLLQFLSAVRYRIASSNRAR